MRSSATAGLIRAHQPKSGEDYFVPMNDDLRAILRALPSRMRSEWVFPSETGDTPLDAKNYLHRVFGPALKRAGLIDFRWHDSRHTFASRLVMAGVDARTVQTLMGHKTLAMTERYAHLSQAHKLAAVQHLNRPVSGEPTATATATRRSAGLLISGGSPLPVHEVCAFDSPPPTPPETFQSIREIGSGAAGLFGLNAVVA